MSKIRMCRHCRRKKANRPGELYWTCYYTPGVRDLYPRQVYVGDHYGYKPASVPCLYLPGTAEHQQCLAERVKAGESLYHPEDARRV